MHRICWNYIRQREANTRLFFRLNDVLFFFVCSARKYAKWWSQCYLTGIEQILLGFRDDYGIVRQMQTLLIKDIETRAVRGNINAIFHENTCLYLLSVHGVQVHI